MNTMTIIAWTLLHFIWQGMAIAIALRLALHLMRDSSSLTRYATSVVALVLIVVSPVITSARLMQERSQQTDLTGVVPAARGVVATPFELTGATEALTANSAQNSESGAQLESLATPSVAPVTEASSAPTTWSVIVEPLSAWTDAAAPFLVFAWLIGVVLLSLRFLGGWLQVRGLTRTALAPADAQIVERLARLANELGVTRSVQLLESALVQVPTVVGWLKPVLLMPLSLECGLTPRELELLLAHELAHIRRHDYLVNLLQTVVETALFYHPGVWWISDQIRQEREHCCDDVAIAVFADRQGYARALLRLEELRQEPPLLAVAASGGSLLRRIRRLVSAPSRHADARGRWAAIPLGVAALMGIVSGTNVAKAAIFPPKSELPSSAESSFSTDTLRQRPTRDMKPDTVIRLESQTTDLATRWESALGAARRAGRQNFWIGYAIGGDDTRGWVYMDRYVPVYTGNGMMMGNMHFNGRDSGMSFIGVRMDSLVGPHSPEDRVVLFGFVTRNGRVELDRVHASTFVLPVHFAGRSLLWLGDADDRQSVDLARRLFTNARSTDMKNDLVQIVALHADDGPVLAALRAWLESTESDDIRAEAAEALGVVSTPAALALTARTARTDRSRRVRQEATEALGETDLPQATDTLIALAHSVTDTEVRREAIETLGERKDARAFEAVVKLAWENISTELQREAVETLGEMENERALGELERLARTHPNTDVRQEAVETLGELDRPAEVMPILRDLIDRDNSSDVRREAVETLGEVRDTRALKELTDLARTHRDTEVRRHAIETLADHGEKETVLEILSKLLDDGTGESDQKAAIEAVGNLDDERAVAMLEKVATTSSSTRLRKAAAEALGSVAPHDQAWAALNRIIWNGSDEDAAKSAVETLGDVEHDGLTAALVRIASEHPRGQVRQSAIEELGDHHESPGALAALSRIARTADDVETRKTALDAYSNGASGAEAIALMSEVVKNDRSFEVQESALEKLGDLDNHAGVPALIEFARSHPNAELRKRAIEMLGDSDDPRAHAELAKLLQGSGRSR